MRIVPGCFRSPTPPTSSRSRVPLQSRVQHPGWDLPPHLIHLLSIPVVMSIENLIHNPPPSYRSTLNGNHTAETSAFLEAMRALPTVTKTANGATAYTSTSSALVDLFFDLTPKVTAVNLFEMLAKAWVVDALATMKIIFHARSIHEGKGFEEGFYRCMAWVYENHPQTFLDNLQYIVKPTCQRERDGARDDKKMAQRGKNDSGVIALDDEDMEEKVYPARPHGCFDDLNNMLVLYVDGQFTTSYTGDLHAIHEGLAPAGQARAMKKMRMKKDIAKGKKSASAASVYKGKHAVHPRHHLPVEDTRKAIWAEKSKIGKQILLRQRFDRLIASGKKFQAFYLVVVDIFARQIQADLSLLNKDRDSKSKVPLGQKPIFGLSYAAKWAVTPGKGMDKQLLIASAIALRLFPGDGITSARRRYQAEVLSPLRAALKVPEVAMSANQWEQVSYNQVPSRAMARNASHFIAHDTRGFQRYLDQVADGLTTIAGASMLPHELLMTVMRGDPVQTRLADLQWRTMVQGIRNSSKSSLKNCLAIADTSGSMGSIHDWSKGQKSELVHPIHPCIALTLLLADLAAEPWHGHFFTFSSKPTFEYINPALPLSDRAAELSTAHWQNSTNLRAVFTLILNQARSHQLAPKDMIQTLFIFSDMQFNSATRGLFTETYYETIKRDFEQAGYTIPQLVFWNLHASPRVGGTPKPVTSGQSGVSLMSGFSGAIMKYFIGQEDEQRTGEQGSRVMGKPVKENNPLETVMAVIAKPSFSGIVVVD